MKKKYKIMILFVLAFSLLLSGCNHSNKKSYTNEGSGQQYYDFDDYYDVAEEMEMPMAAYAMEESGVYESKSASSSNSNADIPQQRMIQKSASINVQVMDPEQAAQSIIELTEKNGGFVVSSSSSQEYYSGDIYLPRADLSIRVPSETLLETLDFIENLTTDKSKYVSNKRIFGVDITSDYVDTTSRLSSLEKTRDKLYEILDTAENAEEALEVYSSIADVETDIEVYKGQIKYMEESVSFSSIEIRITSVRPAPIHTVQKWNPGDVAKDAFESLLDAGKSVIEFLIYFIIVVIPILILIAIPIVLIILLIKKLIRSKRNKIKKTDAEETKEDKLAEIK